jgi:hypothetical protein
VKDFLDFLAGKVRAVCACHLRKRLLGVCFCMDSGWAYLWYVHVTGINSMQVILLRGNFKTRRGRRHYSLILLKLKIIAWLPVDRRKTICQLRLNSCLKITLSFSALSIAQSIRFVFLLAEKQIKSRIHDSRVFRHYKDR